MTCIKLSVHVVDGPAATASRASSSGQPSSISDPSHAPVKLLRAEHGPLRARQPTTIGFDKSRTHAGIQSLTHNIRNGPPKPERKRNYWLLNAGLHSYTTRHSPPHPLTDIARPPCRTRCVCCSSQPHLPAPPAPLSPSGPAPTPHRPSSFQTPTPSPIRPSYPATASSAAPLRAHSIPPIPLHS